MLSKINFDGGPIAFFGCTESAGKFFLDFRISTKFEVHSFQTDFIFEIMSSSLLKRVFSLSSNTFRLKLIPEVIIHRIVVW